MNMKQKTKNCDRAKNEKEKQGDFISSGTSKKCFFEIVQMREICF